MSGSTEETQAFFGKPAMFGATFVQVLPPFCVTCKLPSSVPAQITSGFSAIRQSNKSSCAFPPPNYQP
jgi:hypothetical protein